MENTIKKEADEFSKCMSELNKFLIDIEEKDIEFSNKFKEIKNDKPIRNYETPILEENKTDSFLEMKEKVIIIIIKHKGEFIFQKKNI
jgi:hypothetical protein